MRKKMPRKLYAFVLSALFAFSTSSFAEVGTTSSIRGVVNVSGAEVTVTHVPTGTTKTRTANEDGLFFVSDLLVGGPYEITASASGYQTQSESGLFLVLNKTAAIDISLVSNDMEEIGVTASASSGTIRMGAGISLGEDAIAGVPTINRSIADYAKFDPRVSINTENSKNSSITVMGAHERFNDFSVDGVSFNDPFGLNDNGFGSMRNPISMEFVDQISVDITPYDVSRGNTTGGSIATVTKSGTNEFHGSVFFIERDEGDVGELFGQDFAEFSEETKGFTFSGPIIEDKLFFFVGYEDFESGLPALYGAADSNMPNKAGEATEADIARIAQITKDRYGFDPGQFTGFTAPETGEKTILKLNANINETHRAVFLYQKDEDSLPAGGYNRFSSNWVYYAPETDRTSLTLYSDWNDRLSTKIRYTNYQYFSDPYSPGLTFPEMTVEVGRDAIRLGGERYRAANMVETESDYFAFKATYDMGNHVISAGIDYEETNFYNLFISRYNGEVVFDSIDDYEAGEYSYLRFHVPQTGILNVDDVAARFDLEKTTLYIQDKIYMGNLTLDVGVRLDDVSTPQAPLLNQKFLARNGFGNDVAFDMSVVQPRIGFNYDASESLFGNIDRVISAEIRGGYGLFMGRIPNVWYSNAYTRSGGLSDYLRVYGWDDDLPSFRCGGTVGKMPAGDPTFFWMGDSSNYCIPSSPYFNDAQVTDPNFEAPSSWRGNIALDITTENGYELTLEYNKDSTHKGVFYQELGLELEGYLADGRGHYSHGPGDYMLTNTDEGGAEAWSASIRKSYDNGLSFFASWAAVDAEDVYALTSSQAESSYGYTQRWDGENVPAARSSFMASRKIIAGLEYRRMFFGDNETRISAIYVRKSGEPYSITFDEPSYKPVGGCGTPSYRRCYSKFYNDYSLAYVPTGANDPNVVFTSASVAADVMAHINSGPLAQYKGTYAPRNAFTTPGYSRLDIRLTQELPGPMDGHKFIFYVDLLNVLNMLDDDKGHVYEYSYNNSRQIEVDGVDADGRFIISGVDPDDSYFIMDNSGQSRWQVQMGLKYQF